MAPHRSIGRDEPSCHAQHLAAGSLSFVISPGDAYRLPIRLDRSPDRGWLRHSEVETGLSPLDTALRIYSTGQFTPQILRRIEQFSFSVASWFSPWSRILSFKPSLQA